MSLKFYATISVLGVVHVFIFSHEGTFDIELFPLWGKNKRKTKPPEIKQANKLLWSSQALKFFGTLLSLALGRRGSSLQPKIIG